MTFQSTPQTQQQTVTSNPLSSGSILQRKCQSCGQHILLRNKCQSCQSNKFSKQNNQRNQISTSPQPTLTARFIDKHSLKNDFSRISTQTKPLPNQTNDLDKQTGDYSKEDQHKVTKRLPSIFQDQGVPIESSIASSLQHRFGFDLGAVRVHLDQKAGDSAQRLGARAFTCGQHIAFGRGAYQPSTSRGKALLAHELSHVSQQLSGNTATESVQERQADAMEAGGSLSFVKASGMKPVLRLRRGDALSLTISVSESGAASFSAEVEGNGVVTATGSVTQLQPGEYQLQMSGSQMVISYPDGSIVPETTQFDLPSTEENSALTEALTRVTSPIPMYVQSGAATTGVGGSPPLSTEEIQRQELAALPERIRNFLFTPGEAPTQPEDYAALLRIAQSIADLSDVELAEYRARTIGRTSNVHEFEESVNRWLTELRERRSAERSLDEAIQALFDLDEIYEMYRSWQIGLMMGSPPSWIYDWERLPASALPTQQEGSLNQLYLRMRRALAPYGYANLAAFTAAIQQFLTAFRETAYHIGLDLLDRYEHILIEQNSHYRRSAGSLYTRLAPARRTFREADEYQAAAQRQFSGWSPDDVHNSYAAGNEYQRRIAQGRSQVAAQEDIQPLLTNPDFPLEEIGRAQDQTAITSVLGNYITEGLEHVRDTRTRLQDDHEIIFNLNVLVNQTKARQGIGSNSIWSKIIDDHQAPTVEETALEVMLGVLAVALGLMSGGSVLVAGASLGLSSYLALQQYEDYAFRSDAYGAQLLSEEPSLAWVVLAIIGVVADFAVVAQVIRPIRPALQTFQRMGDIAELESRLVNVEERIRRSILAQAELELQARRGWQGLPGIPRGAARASLFGIDLVAEGLGMVVYSVQLNLRRGINVFNRWVLTREAIDLIGDINRLTPEQVLQVRTAYRQAVAAQQRIMSHGRSLGMSAEEVERVIQNWAQRRSGSVADVISDMTESSQAGRYTTSIRWGIQDVDARPHSSIEGAFWGRRVRQTNPRVDAYELKINPNNESFYLPHPEGGYVQFENLFGTSVVQDGKLVMTHPSIYHVAERPPFASAAVLREARRQVAAASAAGLRVEWLVSEANAMSQLQDLFQAENISIILRLMSE